MSVLVSTFVQRFEPNRTHSYFYTRRLNRPDRDKFLFALPARQRYLNSDGLENVKNVVKIVNRPLDVRSPNFSPNVSSPSSFSSATNTFHFHFVIQNFPFSIITTAFSSYSNKLYASSFPFANKLINITRNSTFSFYRTHDLYIYIVFLSKQNTVPYPATYFHPSPLFDPGAAAGSNEWKKSGLDAEIDRNEGLRRDKGQEGRGLRGVGRVIRLKYTGRAKVRPG